jgi:hypothetical protein
MPQPCFLEQQLRLLGIPMPSLLANRHRLGALPELPVALHDQRLAGTPFGVPQGVQALQNLHALRSTSGRATQSKLTKLFLREP